MPAFLKKGKIIAYMMLLIFVLFFTLDFGAIDLQKVAIIVTLGLDYDSTQDTYTLSGQVVSSPTGNGDVNAKESQAVIKGTGATPSMALKNMEDNSGWHPYISFCKLVVLSKTVFEKDIINVLDFFIRSEQLSDTAILCTTEESAATLLTSQTQLDQISTFSLLKSLLYNGSKNMNIVATNLKDFTIKFYNSSNGNILTYIKIVPDSLSAAADGQDSENSDSGQAAQSVVFDSTGAAIFLKEKFVGLLSSQETKSYNLITKKTKLGQIDVKDVATPKYFIENCSLEIVNSCFSKKIYFKDDRIKCDINVKADFKIDHLESTDKDINNLVNSQNIPKELKDALADNMKTDIEKMLQTVKSYDSDIFDIEETLFRFHPNKYRQFKKNNPESFLQKTDFNITIQLNTVSN